MKKSKVIKKYFEDTYSKEKNLKVIMSEVRKEEMMGNNKVLKMVATFVLAIGLTAGLVYASTVVYEKVFREPKKYNSLNEVIQDYSNSQGSQEVTKQDEEKAVNMEEAIIEANQVLKKFGIESQEFVTKELKKNYIMGAEFVYYFTTNLNINKGIHIAINAENGKCVMFSNEDLKYRKMFPDKITEEQALQKANEIYHLFGLKESEYQLKKIEQVPYYFQNVGTDRWDLTYCKTYEGAFNQFERVEMAFIIENGELKLYSIWIANEKVEFENNPIEITKEEAEKIALEKDKILTDNEVESISTELQIRQMNSWIYALEQNGGKYPVLKQEVLPDGKTAYFSEYQIVQNIARKVWTVNIHYKSGEIVDRKDNQYYSKSIFVDVTTGEIIGGANE